MGTLQAALSWAQRGFRVFPLRENTREPELTGSWNDIATSDPEKIRGLWLDPVLHTEKQHNIGCVCTGMVVVDVDVKKGKDGYNQYVNMGGNFDTLVVRTTSGGYHCYFNGPDSSNASLTKGVDIRSNMGYVVAPGSVINGVPYEVINDVDISWVPTPIEVLLKPPNKRSDIDRMIPTDTPAAIEQGRGFLESCPPSVLGDNANESTFIIAARLVRDMALSIPTAFCLMRDHWNERNPSPCPLDKLLTFVENASNYGTADLGSMSVEVLFANVNVQPPPSIFDQRDIEWGNAAIPTEIKPRPWLVERFLMDGAVTLLMAAGSSGKSTISLALAAHLALGLDFAGYKARRGCKTIIYNGEDDLAEQSRRLLAVCMSYEFDYDEVKKNIMLLSSRQLKLDLVDKEFNRPVRNDVVVKHIVEKALPPDVGLLILDPLVKVHKCDESDNVQMDYVMETLTDIAHEANIAVLTLHHTSKGGGRQEQRIGNMDIGRGASAIINAARIGFTLLNASTQDAQDYGMKDEDRHLWVRLDDAKMNLTLASDEATWFRKEAVRIPSKDFVGVLRHKHLEKSKDHLRIAVANVLIDSMTSIGKGSLSMPEAVAVVRDGEPLIANYKDVELKKRIEEMFIREVDIKGKKLQVIRDDKKNVLIVMK